MPGILQNSGILLPRGVSGRRSILSGGGVLPAPADPLDAVKFSLRLQTHSGDGKPMGLYQDTACTIPALQDGDLVAAWRDEMSGSGIVAVQPVAAARPTLRFHSKIPMLEFDGDNDALRFDLPIAATSHFSIYSSAGHTGPGKGGNVVLAGGTDTVTTFYAHHYFSIPQGGTKAISAWGSGAAAAGSQQNWTSHGAMHVMSSHYDGTTHRVWLDDVTGTTAAPPASNLHTQDWEIGAAGANIPGQFFQGRITSIAILATGSTTDRERITNHLASLHTPTDPISSIPFALRLQTHRGEVSRYQDTIRVSGAGSTEADGQYHVMGRNDDKPVYTKGESHQFYYSSGEIAWILYDIISATPLYRATGDVTSPALATGWALHGAGAAPTPVVTVSGSEAVYKTIGLYQDTACTIPAREDGQAVAAWRDEISGSGIIATQSIASKRPILRFPFGKPVLRFDGVDDWLSFKLTGAARTFVAAGSFAEQGGWNGIAGCRLSPNSAKVPASDVDLGATRGQFADGRITGLGPTSSTIRINGITKNASDFNDAFTGVECPATPSIIITTDSQTGSGEKNFCIGTDPFSSGRYALMDLSILMISAVNLPEADQSKIESYSLFL